jgi:general secretion pathway protein D
MSGLGNMKIKYFLTCGLLAFMPVLVAEDEGVEAEILRKEAIRLGEQRAQAESHFETGVLLYRQQQYKKAVEQFSEALRLNPEDEEAKRYLMRTRSVMGVREATVQAKSEWLEQNLSVKREAQWTDVNRLLENAEDDYESMKSKSYGQDDTLKMVDIQRLREAYEKVLEKLKPLDASELKRKNNEMVVSRLKMLASLEESTKSSIDARMRKDSQRKMITETKENEDYLKNRVNNILSAAETELEKERFQACLELCEDVLTVDPANARAIQMRGLAVRARARKADSDIDFNRKKELRRRLLKIKEAFIPYASSVVYPDDWEVVANRQSQEFGKREAPAWKRSLESMLDKYLSYRCPGLPLVEVLQQLSELSGLNIVLSPKVIQEKDESELELNEFNYGHMKLRHILQWVCREVDLAYVLKYDVIYVTNRNAASENTVIRVYDVQDLLATKQNFAAPTLQDGFAGEGGEELEIAADDIEQEDPISGDVLVEMIQKSIAGNWEEGENVLIRPLETGAILIKNTPEVHGQVMELLNTLRKTSALQVEVEARSLTVSEGFFREIGFDWTGLNSVSALSSGSAVGFVDQTNDKYDLKAAIVNSLASEIPGVGFFMEHSILGSFQAKVLMKALEQDEETTELIAPKLVLVNNVLGYIRLGRTQNYISGYETGEGDDSVGIQPTIETVDEGQLLAVTATVSSDRKYITLRLHPDFQDVSIPRTAQVTGTQTTATLAGESVTSYSLPVDLPEVTKRQVRTTAVIPDDGVLILGGVSSTSEESRSKGVPILSKVPFLGRLFRSDHKSDSSKDEMLLVHGKIIVFDELEAGL